MGAEGGEIQRCLLSFCPSSFCQSVFLFLQWQARVEKWGGKKMKSKSNHQSFWDATWNSIVPYCTHRITKAVAEGINSRNRAINRRMGFYRNHENFKKAIMLHFRGLDLCPRLSRMDLFLCPCPVWENQAIALERIRGSGLCHQNTTVAGREWLNACMLIEPV
ncbi:transposase [Pirellulaceae bacterium SH501]